ncbi:helix-turn-helix transcriptional regulator [uncultured Merdimonas sp.]|uniref:helix-turn-helix transcriptional regulator n=1 Tax=uncultured Merdimonas sp. TaxID=2023269 RepID=UPI00320BA140
MNKNAIANRLVELRGNRSQEEVAKAVNISTSALSMYENGSRVPRDEIKIRLAAFYGKSVQYIFFNKNDTNRDEAT